MADADMILTVPVMFKPAGVTQTMGTFIQSHDVNGNWTDFRQFGNWMLPGAGTKPGPYVMAVSPSSGAGTSGTFNINVGHTGGVGNLGEVHVRFNDAIVGGTPCHVVYFAFDNSIALINDAGTDLTARVALSMGSSTGRCSVAPGGARTASGNQTVFSLPMVFDRNTFAGTKNIYVNAFDLSGALSHWISAGSFTVQ